jgi:hypothetical protein
VRSIARVLVALWMAFAILAAQHAVAMHDLAHAAGHKEGVPGKTTCDKCFACAQLSSAVGATIPPVTLPEGAPLPSTRESEEGIRAAARLAFRSRAPPARS